MGQPIMGDFQLAQPADIQVIEVLPENDDGSTPRLESGPIPMIVSAAGTAVPR